MSAQSPRWGAKKQSNEPITARTGAIPTTAGNTDTTSLVVADTPKLTWRDRAHRVVAAERAPTWSLDLRAIQDGVENSAPASCSTWRCASRKRCSRQVPPRPRSLPRCSA